MSEPKTFSVRIEWVEYQHGDIHVKASSPEEAEQKVKADLEQLGKDSAYFQAAQHNFRFDYTYNSDIEVNSDFTKEIPDEEDDLDEDED